MLGNVTWLLKQIAENIPLPYGRKVVTFYSSFEENCQQIVNYSLPPR